MFGLRWLRKAILRAVGIIALHDEDAAFARETRELSEAGRREAHGFDWIGGLTAFKIVLMEGIEVVFIVIAVGAGRGLLGLASAGALAACVAVAAVGAAIHRPLARVPENALKFAVGVMLSCLRPVLDRRESWGRVAGRRRGDPRLYRPVPGRRLRSGRASQAKSSRARMIGAIVKELIGLFVDDELLAAAILGVVAFISALTLSGAGAGLARRPPADAGVAGRARGERIAQRAAADAERIVAARRAGARGKAGRDAWLDASSTFPRRCGTTLCPTRRGTIRGSSTSIISRACRKSCRSLQASRQEDLPDGQGWAIERVQLTTHNGTHLDAPWHYHPTMNEGERAWTIDEVPLEWCFQPGVKLDFRHFPDGYVATAADIDEELKRIGYALKPLDIVVVNTSAGAKYGRPDYVASGCGMGAEGTLHLLKQGVRVTGTDGWSWDAPFIHTAKRYGETHDASLIWEGHKAGRHIGYCHIEKLHNLEALPSTGFTVCCFPTKIERASAGWTRAVAIIDE